MSFLTIRVLTGAEILIGMDIIGTGDFAVSNYDNKTTFSFRWPSISKIDFVKEVEEENRIDVQPSITPENRRARRNREKSQRKKRN